MTVLAFSFAALMGLLHLGAPKPADIPVLPFAKAPTHVVKAVTIPIYPMGIPVEPFKVKAPTHVKPAVTIPIYPM
jgi:hypothetical protein